jgi:hypothetical protein
MDTWRSHFPITNFALQALRKKTVEAESTEFSRAEVFNACEFWSAVATRQLAHRDRQLSDDTFAAMAAPVDSAASFD